MTGLQRDEGSDAIGHHTADMTVHRSSGSSRPRPSIGTRVLLTASARREIRSRYRESLGQGLWTIVQPVSVLVLYGFVFTQILGTTGGGLPYLSMAWAGIICWQFATQALQGASWSFVEQAGTVSKVWYPRAVVPLTPIAASVADLLIGVVLLLVVARLQGISPTVTYAALPLALLVLLIWTAGLALLVAPLTVFIRDLTAAVPLLLRAGFFATPVMYPADLIPADYAWLESANPFAVVISAVRDISLEGDWPDWTALGVQLAAGSVALGCGAWYLRRVENRLVDAL